MEIDGNEWAVDHCLVPREPDLPPAMAQAEKALSSRLQAIAEAHKCGLAVSYLPQAKSGHSRQEIEDYYNEVTATAEAAAKSEPLAFIDFAVQRLPDLLTISPFAGMLALLVASGANGGLVLSRSTTSGSRLR